MSKIKIILSVLTLMAAIGGIFYVAKQDPSTDSAPAPMVLGEEASNTLAVGSATLENSAVAALTSSVSETLESETWFSLPEPWNLVQWQRLEEKELKFKNGDLVIRGNGTLHLGNASVTTDTIDSRAIHSEHLDTGAVNSRIIEDGSIAGEDLATDAEIDISSLTVAGTATIAGNLAVNTDDLYVDTAAGRVGIGTSAPSTELEVEGTVTADTFVGSGSGIVGITYYVSTTGDDSNSGLSVEEAWLTAQKAADTAVAGDTVIFQSGTYAGATYTTSGTAQFPITFKAAIGATVIFHAVETETSGAVILPEGTEWTNTGSNVAGNSTIWTSPAGSVPIDGTGGVMRNHSYWFARTSLSNNPRVHGTDPWYWYDATNDLVKINLPTDPSLDEWVIINPNSVSTRINGADYLVFQNLIFEYSYDGLHASNSADNNTYENLTFRYNGRRGMSIKGETSARTVNQRVLRSIAHTNGEHGFKQTSDGGGTFAGNFYLYDQILAYNNGYHGIQISNGANNVTVQNSVAHDNGINPCGRINTGSEGCASSTGNFSNGQSNDNIAWLNNEAYSSPDTVYFGTDNSGLLSYRAGLLMLHNVGITVRGNNFHHNYGSGIVGFNNTGTGTAIIESNQLNYNRKYGIDGHYAQYARYAYNTMNYNETGQLHLGATATDVTFYHNTLTSSAGQILVRVDTGASATFDDNVYSSPDELAFLYNGTSYDFADYKTASSQDASSSLSRTAVIDSLGNMGIGTTTPGARVHALSATEQFRMGYDANNYWSSTVDTDGGLLMQGVGTGGSLTLSPMAGQDFNISLSGTGDLAVNTDDLFVDTSSGYVGMGTNAPSAELEVVGDIVSTGTKWTARTAAANNNWRAITYGNGMFVALSASGSGNRVMTSPDGINWTSRTSAANNFWTSVVYGNGLFVAVASGGTNRVMTSPDGINWTTRTPATETFWNSVTYGNGLFVAVAGTSASTSIMTSPDGITWTSRTSPVATRWNYVEFVNGKFVAVGAGDAGNTTRAMTSTDGITWTEQTTPEMSWIALAYGNGLFVAVANSGTGDRIMTSPDGVTWTARTAPADNDWFDIAYGNGLFVAVAFAGTEERIMTSPDGINWTLRDAPVQNAWGAITYGNGMFVAVAYTSSGDRIMTSGKAEEIPLVFNNLYQGGMNIYGNVGIGGTVFGTSAYNTLAIAGSTAPSTAITDGIQLFAVDQSGSHELRVMDEAGNVTTLSPHNFSLIPDGRSEDLAWAFYSEQGEKAINVDMTRALRLLEQLAGENLLYIQNLASGKAALAQVGEGAFAAIDRHEEAIEALNLKTDRNVTTISGLQTSVDEQLTVVAGNLKKLEDARKAHEAYFVNDQEAIETLNNEISTLTGSFAGMETEMSIYADQISLLETQMATLVEFYSALDLGGVITKDVEGNVDLEGGKLSIGTLETGGIVVTNTEEDAPTIGRAYIEKGETSWIVETEAVTEASRIFLAPQAETALSFPLTITDTEAGASFTVSIPEALTEAIWFDWWVVEEQGRGVDTSGPEEEAREEETAEILEPATS